jgi:hypothetical protein
MMRGGWMLVLRDIACKFIAMIPPFIPVRKVKQRKATVMQTFPTQECNQE